MECNKEQECFNLKPHYFAQDSTENRFAHNQNLNYASVTKTIDSSTNFTINIQQTRYERCIS